MIINIDETTDFERLNRSVRNCTDKTVTINGCIGQRYIGIGISDKSIEIHGTPGNALGAYLNGGEVCVFGNVQDAVGDTMNGGLIVVHGSAGDATGYAMRGGRIYVEGNVGYRAGIHMKAYDTLKPIIVVGGRAGSFLGEYQAGGIIVVLGMNADGLPIINNFCGTGMHGGKMYLRCKTLPHKPSAAIRVEHIRGSDDKELSDIVNDYCAHFDGFDPRKILDADFSVLRADEKNPYTRLYTDN